MCTAATYQTKDFYFGRNLDYERSYGESVVITPRNRPLPLRHGAALKTHYAMIGMAHMQDGFPLYYDAVNEKGLCIAGLNFVGNAVYHPPMAERENVAQFELIPWLLGRCATLAEARQLLERLNPTDDKARAMQMAEARNVFRDIYRLSFQIPQLNQGFTSDSEEEYRMNVAKLNIWARKYSKAHKDITSMRLWELQATKKQLEAWMRREERKLKKD